MNFDYSEEQKFLKEEVRRFLAAECPRSVPRRVADDERLSFDEGLWSSVANMGWTGAVIPEKWGGSGLGYVELCAIAEELGRVIAPIPFASTVYIFAEAVLALGSEAQQDALLPAIASGKVIGCLADSEGPGAGGAAQVQTRAAQGRLSGVKIPVVYGDVATHAIVTALEDGKPGLFLVDLCATATARKLLPTLDPTRGAARLEFSGAPCERLGPAGDSEASLDKILDRAAVLMSFEQVGGADRCLEVAKIYALERHAFGRAIGSYQAIKHKLADMFVKNELARSSAYYGAWALNDSDEDLAVAAAAARIAGTSAYDFAAKENLHVHGGIGFTWEMDCHLHLRRARQLALALGGPPFWRERLVRALERRSMN